jgi:hypothetical protein
VEVENVLFLGLFVAISALFSEGNIGSSLSKWNGTGEA